MPSVRTPYRLSNERAFALTSCPKCGSSTDLRGPIDGKRSATFLFTRAWYCVNCWWDREMQFLDDAAQAQAQHAKQEAKSKAARERRRGTA